VKEERALHNAQESLYTLFTTQVLEYERNMRQNFPESLTGPNLLKVELVSTLQRAWSGKWQIE
jgi:hypothetical protein